MKYSYIPIIGEYDYVSEFQEGLAFVRSSHAERKVGYIDETGKVAIPLNYQDNINGRFVDPCFCEGRAALIKDGKVGFVDKSGKVVIPFDYEYAHSFFEGLAAVKKDDKWGYLNRNSEIVIPLKYEIAFPFREGHAIVGEGGSISYIDRDDKATFTLAYGFNVFLLMEGFSEGLMPVIGQDGKKGYINEMGKVSIPVELEYDTVGHFREGLAPVKIGVNEPITFSPTPSYTRKLEEHKKRIKEATKHIRWGFINRTGNIAVPIEYTSVSGPDDGLLILKKDGVQIFADLAGNNLFQTEYDEMGYFSEGFAIVKKGDDYSFIDRTAKVVISLGNNYDHVSSFRGAHAAVEKGGKYSFIDGSGKLIAPLEFEQVGVFSEGYAVAMKDGEWCIIQTEVTENRSVI